MTRKIILLALADQANDEWECWPSMQSLATRCELNRETIRLNIAAMEAEGILEREVRERANGSQTSNLFRIREAALSPLPARPAPTSQTGRGDTSQTGRGDTSQTGSPEPSYEPTAKPSTQSEAPLLAGLEEPGFPRATIMEAWNRLTDLQRVTGINGKRERATRARWQQLRGEAASFEEFCKRVQASDFLTGRVAGRDERKFKADFDWCMTPANFDKIREGRYDNRTTEKDERHRNKPAWLWDNDTGRPAAV